MEALQEYWPQYVGSNAIALVVLLLAWKTPFAARMVLGLIFLAASIVNTYVAITNPADYLNYGKFAWLPVYREFIDGWFAQNTRLFVLSIAAGQFFVALGMFVDGPIFRIALIGIGIFGVAIAPLGIGSAFPCSLLLAAGAMLLWKKIRPRGQLNTSST